MATINLKIQADSKSAETALDRLEKNSDDLIASLKKANNEYKNPAIEKLQKELKNTATQYRVMGDAAGGVRATKTKLRAAIKNLIGEGLTPADARIKALSAGYKKMSADSAAATRKTKALNSSYADMRSGLTKLVAGYVAVRSAVVGLNGAYGAARDFTKQIKNVTTLTDDFTFEKIRNEVKTLPSILGNAAELTEGLYQALSAGVEPAESIKFVGTAAKFAKAGLTDTETAVDVLTTALNAYGLSAGDAADVSDIFFQTIKKGKTTGAALAANLGKAIPVFSGAGVALDELSAGLATMTLTGSSTEKATTMLNAVVSGFLKPSEKMKNLLKEQGKESGATLLATEGLAGAIEFLKEQTRGNADAMAELMVNELGFRGGLALLSQEGKLYTDVLASMADRAGATEEAFKKQIDDIDRMAAVWRDVKREIGEAAESFLMQLAPALTKVAEYLSGLDWGGVAVGIGTTAAALAGMKIAALAAAGGFHALKGALITSGVGALVVGIGAAAYGIYKLAKNWDEAQIVIGETLAKLKSHFEIAWDSISTWAQIAWAEIKKGVVSVATHIQQFLIDQLQYVTNILAKIPGFGWAKKADEDLRKFSATLEETRAEAIAATELLRSTLKKESEETIAAEKLKIAEIKKEAAARKALLDIMKETALTPAPAALSSGGVGVAGGATAIDGAGDSSSPRRGPRQILSNRGRGDGGLKEAAAIVSATAAVQTLRAEWDKVGYAVSRLSTKHVPGLGDAVQGVGNLVGGVLGIIDQGISKLGESFSDSSQKMVEAGKAAWQNILSAASAALDGIAGIISGVSQMYQQAAQADAQWAAYYKNKEVKEKSKIIDDELAAELAALKKSGLGADAFQDEKEKRESKAAVKKKELENQAAMDIYDNQVQIFETMKAARLVEAIMAGAAAIVMAYAQLGPIAGLIAAGIMAGITGLQVGIIKSQKPPPPPVLAASGVSSYMVPPGYQSDKYPIAARSGERITVTPFGKKTDQVISLTINIGGRNVAKTIQKLIDNEEISIA